MAEAQSGLIYQLSQTVGTTEPALRLLLSLFIGYPLALFHRHFLYFKSAVVQHLFFILCGLSIGYFNYGFDILHTFGACIISYVVIVLGSGSTFSVAFIFIFNLGYLLFGYYKTSTSDYDICWTMPQCIQVLRVIGLAFDLYDGQQPEETLSSENRKVALKYPPTVVEFLGHMFFPSSFLVGPQFPMKRYQDFVARKFNDNENQNELPHCVGPALKRFGLGVLYLSIFQGLGLYVSDDLLTSEYFDQQTFIKKMFILGVWGQFTLYKYISCWLLTEGACILFGLTYNGKNENGESLWNGCENIKLSVFERTTQFNHYIMSFNVNTNHWVAQYIYKRLKFMGNKYISQIASLLFLAIWHGYHDGYYMCFAMEFIIIFFERDIQVTVRSNEKLSEFLAQPAVRVICLILLRIYTFTFMGWCLLPFSLLKFNKYWPVMRSVYYIGFVLFWVWPILYGPLFRMLVGRKRRTD